MANGEPKQIVINISSGTIIKTILLIGLFVALYYLIDLVLVLLTAVVIASAIEPAIRWFASKRVPRVPATILMYLVVGMLFVAVFYFIVPTIIDDVLRISKTVPQYLDSISLWNPLSETTTITDGVEAGTQVVREGSSGTLYSNLLAYTTNDGSGFLHLLSTVFGGFLSFILIVVVSFYLAVQKEGIDNFLRLVTPIKQQAYVIDLWKRSQLKIGLWMQGQLLLGLLVGVLVYLGLAVLGVKNAMLLGFVAGMFELIPLFGPVLAAVPAILLGFTDGLHLVDPGVTAALIVAGFYLLIQQFENHIIYPLVVRKVVGVPPLIVILALIIGAKFAGFLGIILSVPIAAVFMEFMNDIAKEKNIFAKQTIPNDKTKK